MGTDKPVASSDGADDADLVKAFQELAKGERTATALENQLSNMEAKIEALLAQAEQQQQETQSTKEQSFKDSTTNSEKR
nr:hypothetical protein CFP56_56879 [Quercus suber]